MEKSLYADYIRKYFPALVLRTVERMNGQKPDVIPPYRFKELLTPTFSVDGRWATMLGEYGRVAADIVSMDSSLPIKRRDTLEKVSGEIPKIGIEMNLNEKQMTDIDIMISLGLPEQDIVAKILDDVPRVITSVYERNELTLLRGLCDGVVELYPFSDSADNVGQSIRLDYKFLEENKFGVSALDLSDIISDLRKVREKARYDGNALMFAYMDENTFRKIISTAQFKEYFAFGRGFVGSNIAIPTYEQANAVFSEQFGFTVVFVDRVIKTERNGVRKAMPVWTEGMIAFTAEKNIGNLVWSRLAEASRPVSGVSYQTADSYMLVSKYAKVQPAFAEFTTCQARVLPVISKIEKIYHLDTKTVQA